MAPRLKLAVIIPMLNEAGRIGACIGSVRSDADELVVVDGGSTDECAQIACSLGASVMTAERGRASQMNAGAASCTDADVLLFVHADVALPVGWRAAIEDAVRGGARWGRFDVSLDSARPMLRCVGFMMNLRSRLTGIATGDQAIFLSREAWNRCGGWPDVPLMEDIRLSKRLCRWGWRPACLRQTVSVSARRWESKGVLRTIAWMTLLRSLHACGVSCERLHRMYYGAM